MVGGVPVIYVLHFTL